MEKTFVYKDPNAPRTNSEFISDQEYTRILELLPIVCVDLVVVRSGKVLLAKRKDRPCQGVYCIQGGRLLKNENPETCGIRRFSEEFSISKEKISITAYLGTFSTEFEDSAQGPPSHTINITYQAHLAEDVVLNIEKYHADMDWFSLNGEMPDRLKGKYKHHPYVLHLLSLVNLRE